MVIWFVFIIMSLFWIRPFNAFIFLHTSDGFVFPLMVDVNLFHDSFFLFFYTVLAFGSEFLKFDKIFEGFIFFEIYKCFIFVEYGFFYLIVPPGNSRLFCLIDCAYCLFCAVSYKVCKNLCNFFYIDDVEFDYFFDFILLVGRYLASNLGFFNFIFVCYSLVLVIF